MTNRAGAAILLAAMAFGSVTAIRTAQDVMRDPRLPNVLPDRRLEELPEFIVTELRNGTRAEGRFTARRILTAGGLACEVTIYATSAYAPSTCEVNTPIPNPERFVSLTATYIPYPPFTTSEDV